MLGYVRLKLSESIEFESDWINRAHRSLLSTTQAHRAIASDPAWRARLLTPPTLEQAADDVEDGNNGESEQWSELLAFLGSPAAAAAGGFGGKREAQAYASLVRQRVEAEERAGKLV